MWGSAKRDRTATESKSFGRLIAFAVGFYFFWWFAVEWLLPGSFNPLPSRMAVVGMGLAALAASFTASSRAARYLFYAVVWLITIHYYYLFFHNGADTNWIVGCYITVMTINLGFPSRQSLLLYSSLVIALSLSLFYLIPPLRESVFLPGLLTILVQAIIAMHSRLRAEREAVLTAAMAENVRVRDEFISVASHELKTPIASLKLQLQMMERTVEAQGLAGYTKTDLREVFALIRRQTNRLTELIEAVLDVSRIANGKLELERKELELGALILDTTNALLSDPHAQKQVKVRVKTPLKIFADPLRVSQVVENLLTNARKYGDGKPIEVTLTSSGSDAVLSVRDQGIGIPPEFMPKLFSRFERAASSRHVAGLGLGLYIARQIVEAHGGSIHVDTAPEQGSKFTVRFPGVFPSEEISRRRPGGRAG